jgi:hypothetical protein
MTDLSQDESKLLSAISGGEWVRIDDFETSPASGASTRSCREWRTGVWSRFRFGARETRCDCRGVGGAGRVADRTRGPCGLSDA